MDTRTDTHRHRAMAVIIIIIIIITVIRMAPLIEAQWRRTTVHTVKYKNTD